MNKIDKVFLGMAILSFILALLLLMKATIVTPQQQFITSIVLLLVAFLKPRLFPNIK